MLAVASPAQGVRPLKKACAMPAGKTGPGGPAENPPRAVALAAAVQLPNPARRRKNGCQVLLVGTVTPTAVDGIEPAPTQPTDAPSAFTYAGPPAPNTTPAPSLAATVVVIAALTFASVPSIPLPPIFSAMIRAPARAAKSAAFCVARRWASPYPPSITRPTPRHSAARAAANITSI